MHVLINSVFEFVFYFLKIKKNTVLFCSFFGQYNDNPKYISERLHELAPELKLVWVHSSKGRDSVPSYVEQVEYGSIKYLYYLYTSQVVVDNHTGLRSGGCHKNNVLMNLYFRIRSSKKRGQLTLSTWHGTPLKRIALDEPGGESINFYYNCDLLLSGCSFTTRCLTTANRHLIHIAETGTPRNDILLDRNVDVDSLKRRLGLPLGKKIILYAPTFRNDLYLSGVRQITEDFDYSELLGALSNKFGGEWCFAYRVHNLVLQRIDVDKLGRKQEVSIVNANQHDDMAEYLKCIDALITDYSASLFDIVLTEKPCFLYTPDYENYKYSERGFYLDFDSLPFSYAKTVSSLINNIFDFDKTKYDSKRKVFLEKIGNKEEGNASTKVAKRIINFIDNQ